MKLLAALLLLASVAHATGYGVRDPKAAAPVVLSKADGSALYDATGGGAGSTANLTVFQGSGTQSTTAWLVELTSGTSAAKALYVQFSSGSAAYPFYVLSTGTFWANIISSGSATNPWYVQFPSAQAITVATLPLPSNAATETGGNLAAIKAKTDNIPAQGQAVAANSLPVVLTAIQQAALTPPAAITNFANESGGNLASLAAKDFATSAKQDIGNASLSSLDSKHVAGTWGIKVDASTQPLNIGQVGGVGLSTGPMGNVPFPVADVEGNRLQQQQINSLSDLSDKLQRLIDLFSAGTGR